MTNEEKLAKYLDDHNGEPPEIIAFNSEDAAMIEAAKKAGLVSAIVANPYIPKGNMVFIAKGLRDSLFEDPFGRDHSMKIRLDDYLHFPQQ